MKFIAFFALIAAVSFAAFAEDKLVSYDPAASVITVERSGQLKTFRVKPGAELIINDAKSTFDRLTPGLKVTLSLADPQTVARVAVQAGQIPKVDPRALVLKMRVDGTDIVHLRDGELTIEHLTAGPPVEIFVNGVEWKPTWKGKMTEPFTAFNPPLEPFGQSKLVLKQHLGRNKVTMDKAAPVDSDKGLVIRFDDPADGSDVYEIRVSW